ncbi:MAG: hypothetical protein O7G85_11315 [Planctomycetota bacterium]|nr:hypothetical protein [Planctomycetota bacterium]
MTPQTSSSTFTPTPDDLMLIVVGADLRSELTDRMLGYRLREQILHWQDQRKCPDPLLPVVCTDLWYLSQEELLSRPTLTIGDPESNAATALLADRLPTTFLIDETLQVLFDQTFSILQGCLWGINHATTASAVDLFIERYLDDYLRASHGLEESPESES